MAPADALQAARAAVATALLLPFSGVTLAQSGPAPDSTTQQQIAPYLTPQRVVHIGEGRTINLVCLGHCSPTVVLTAGLQNWSLHWWLVQRPLAERTRVCAWDRAGYGFSGPSQEPQDIIHTTNDLERALKGAGIGGPYVMVGHSLGAYEALRFTDLHRQSVIGMILVDPAIPDQSAIIERTAPIFFTKARALDELAVKQLQDCAAELQGGTLKRGTRQFEQCTADSAVPADFPGAREAMARLNTDPARLLTQASTIREFDSDAARDSHEVINAQRRYGNMPLIVLTAGGDESSLVRSFTNGVRPAEAAQFDKQVAHYIQDAWIPAHDAYASLSTRGRNQLVDSSHSIQIWKPEAVISAIAEVLDEASPSAPHKP